MAHTPVQAPISCPSDKASLAAPSCKESIYLPIEQIGHTLKFYVFNIRDGKHTTLEINPASCNANPPKPPQNSTVVALGSRIYLLGGQCRISCCAFIHSHVDVIYFDALSPNDGWRVAAPMLFGRRCTTTAIAVDGKIYVFGGLCYKPPATPDDYNDYDYDYDYDRDHDYETPKSDYKYGEVYDPNTDQWHPLPDSPGFSHPRFLAIQAVYTDPKDRNKKGIIFDDLEEKRLYAFNLDDNSWSYIDECSLRSFNLDDYSWIGDECSLELYDVGAVVDDVLYAAYIAPLSYRVTPLWGYDLINKKWLPVKFPLLGCDPGLEGVDVFDLSNGKLCLSGYIARFYNWELRRSEATVICIEFKVTKEVSENVLVGLIATEVSESSFLVECNFFKSMIAL